MSPEVVEVSAELGPTIVTCPHCGAPLRINVDVGDLVHDVTNAATTATNLVNAGNIVRRLLQSGQVPPEVLEDVQRAEAAMTAATAHLTGGFM